MISAESAERIQRHLTTLYARQADQLAPRVAELAERYVARLPNGRVTNGAAPRWSERDIALITYGDQVAEDNVATLETLRRFLDDFRLEEAFSIVHILPFCPYSSDDGFSVIDFRKVDSRLGDWSDLRRLGQQFDLMYDLVLNHISQRSAWFQGYLKGDPNYANWFHDVDAELDLSQVTRPRSHPLLTPFSTPGRLRHIWTTFSADQIDLNYAEPRVLWEMLDILLEYVANGARVIRLDAIAFLWKEIGTTCLHLPQTHAVVKLCRTVLDAVAPHVILLTETNVPHAENISYFGDGDEAHMVYNFSLPPLLYDAYVNQEARPLETWLRNLAAPRPGATWFNFTASHDGIGVRPLEGLVDAMRIARLVEATRQRGGEVSMRQLPNGELSPYELNITWRDAMRRPGQDDPMLVRRVLASQAFMLALQGVPAPYFHSLVGTPNDVSGMRETGQARRINRKKYRNDELREAISQDPIQSAIFAGYVHLLALRRGQPAFHPDGSQHVLSTDDPAIVAFERVSPDGAQAIVVVSNFADTPRNLPEGFAAEHGLRRDLITGRALDVDNVMLQPSQAVWLEAGGR